MEWIGVIRKDLTNVNKTNIFVQHSKMVSHFRKTRRLYSQRRDALGHFLGYFLRFVEEQGDLRQGFSVALGGCAATSYLDQAGLELTEILLPLPP